MFWHYGSYLILLLLGVVWYLADYHWGWFGPTGLLERALDAAEEGDTERTLYLLRRAIRKSKPKGEWCSCKDLVSSVVMTACESGHPDTAEMVLYALELRRSDLIVVEKKGARPVPLLEYLQHEPELFSLTIAFLTQESGEEA